MNQYLRVRNVAANDTIKISAPVPMSDAASAEQSTKHTKGTVQCSKEKQKSSRSEQKDAYPDKRSYEKFSD